MIPYHKIFLFLQMASTEQVNLTLHLLLPAVAAAFANLGCQELLMNILGFDRGYVMNTMKLVILFHSLYWSIHTKDESKRGTAFAFIFGVN